MTLACHTTGGLGDTDYLGNARGWDAEILSVAAVEPAATLFFDLYGLTAGNYANAPMGIARCDSTWKRWEVS